MPETYKVCPICKTANPTGASFCMTCGTALSTENSTAQPILGELAFEYQFAETDLMERAVHPIGRRYMVGGFVFLVVMMLVGVGIILAPTLLSTAQQTLSSLVGVQTPTARPTFIRPTITQGPPTRTPTPTIIPTDTPEPTATREPCRPTVLAGDSMWDVVARCGHFNSAVFNIVVELNNLRDAGTIFAGQVLEVPWPTPTLDPNQPTPDPEMNADIDPQTVSFDPFFFPTPTLQPGIQLHRISAGENIITVILQYDITVEILSQLNPEVSFSQCDFGVRFGGERCTVMIFEGQSLRVPAPTPTLTFTPTPSGSETPTPTLTPTFNAPIPQSPSNRILFRRNDLVTLRWSPTGTLGTDETYRVNVRNITLQMEYTAYTSETSFVIPTDWQGRSDQLERHEYEWSISVVNINDTNRASYTTQTMLFVWETRTVN